MRMKIRIKNILILMLLLAAMPVNGMTPAEVLQKTVAKLDAAPGISARFIAKGDQGSLSGLVVMDGTRSYMEFPQQGRQWFDGKTMWTLNPNTREVTVSNPEPSELRDANPFLYLKGYNKEYRLFFSKRKEAGRYLVLLNPRGKSNVKAIEVAVNTTTFLPERFTVRMQDDQVSTVSISQLNLNKKCTAADFTFPAAKYKEYEIVDLR